MLSLLLFVLGLIPMLALQLLYVENLRFSSLDLHILSFPYFPLFLVSSFSYPFQAPVLSFQAILVSAWLVCFSYPLLQACLFVCFSFVLSVFYKSLGLCDLEDREENLALLISSTWMWYESVN